MRVDVQNLTYTSQPGMYSSGCKSYMGHAEDVSVARRDARARARAEHRDARTRARAEKTACVRVPTELVGRRAGPVMMDTFDAIPTSPISVY